MYRIWGGVTFESVYRWPQVQDLRVVWVSLLCTSQDRVYPETPSLSFSCSVSFFPELCSVWVERVALIYLWSIVCFRCIHMRSGALGKLCSLFYWVTNNTWCAVSEPHLRFWPQHGEAHPLTPRCGEGKEASVAGAEQGVQGRLLKRLTLPEGFHGKFKDKVKEGVMACMICSGTFSWLAGGEVIRSQHHHLLVLTGLKSVCLWAACSQLLHLVGVSARIGQLTVEGSEHYLQPLRRNIDPWVCSMARLLFCLLWQVSFLSTCSHFSG